MKALGITLGLGVVLLVLLLVMAAPTSAGGIHGNDQAPAAWGQGGPKPDGGQKVAAGHIPKGKHAPDHPAGASALTYTGTITVCHKLGTPAEKTLVLPAPAVPGHLRHGDHVGACLGATLTITETITVCHKPGTPAQKTLVLPEAAEYGHMQHGDELGACPGAAAAAPVVHGRWRGGH